MYIRPAPSSVPYPATWQGRRVIVLPRVYRRGLGASTSAIVGGFTSGATIGYGTAMSTGSEVAGAVAGGLMAAAPFTGPAAPFLIAAATLIAPIASLFKGCGQTCIQATQYADQAGTALSQLLAQYMAQPVHYRSAQVAALSYFDQVWSWLTQSCSNPQLGAAGRRCITDRQAGSTAYRVAPFGWTQQNGQWVYVPAGANGSGNVPWNWFAGIRDPIANDPTVVEDPAGSSILSAVGINPQTQIAGHPLTDWFWPAALVVGGLLLA